MKDMLTQQATAVVQSDKIAQGIATIQIGNGLAIALDWITPAVGFLTALSGLALSIIFIISKRKSNRREEEKHEVEMAILRKKLKE